MFPVYNNIGGRSRKTHIFYSFITVYIKITIVIINIMIGLSIFLIFKLFV